MKHIRNLFVQSWKELHHASTLAVSGILLALTVVLAAPTIMLSSTLRITFSFLPLTAGGMLFGPAVGGVMGVASDILDYFVRPSGPFFPGFTISALLSGLLYGVFLYRKPVTWYRVLLVSALVTVSTGMFLNILWLSILYHQPFGVLFMGHIVTEMILFPINTVLMYLVLKTVERVRVRVRGTVG